MITEQIAIIGTVCFMVGVLVGVLITILTMYPLIKK